LQLREHGTSREIWADPARRLRWQEGQITLKTPVEGAAGRLWPGEAAKSHPRPGSGDKESKKRG
jgi:hypothetical protein